MSETGNVTQSTSYIFRTPKVNVAATFLTMGDLDYIQAYAALDIVAAVGEIQVGTQIINYIDGRYYIRPA